MKAKPMSFFFVLAALMIAGCCFGSVAPARPNGLYKFEGKLNGKIPVFLWFTVKDSVLKGEVTYTNTAKRIPIIVAGTLEKTSEAISYDLSAKTNFLRIREFAGDGTITGVFLGEITAGTFKGLWQAPNTEKQLPFILTASITALPKAIDFTLKPISLNGAYTYHYGKNGYVGGVDINQTKSGMVTVALNSVTAGPAYNIAEVAAQPATVRGNIINVKLPHVNCKFRIRVFKDFLVVNLLNDLDKCEWGNNATVEGIYLKTSAVGKF
ncbi:hypothetical protein [Mucilaginibacter psychrotolerans]|nr:hypothetical protein [Mucilaginibacter psychrotolerans]